MKTRSTPNLTSIHKAYALWENAEDETVAEQALQSYFSILAEIGRNYIGVISIPVPGARFPLLMRCGTSDYGNLRQMFFHREYGFDFPTRPTTILDVGAYVGYAAVFLATRFPDAEIVSLEPTETNFRTLFANTRPYPNVTPLNAALWPRRGGVAGFDHEQGDWGAKVKFVDGEAAILAITVEDILERFGWTEIDFLKCDCEGAEVEILKDPNVPWARRVKLAAVETHDRFAPGSTEITRAFFSGYSETKSGEFLIFAREQIGSKENEQAQVVFLFDSEAAARPVRKSNVTPHNWAFFVYDRHSIQLHPSGNPSAPASVELDVPVTNGVFRRLEFVGVLPKDDADPVEIVVECSDENSNDWILLASLVVQGGERNAAEVILPEGFGGQHKVKFTTKMAPEARSRRHAWARIEQARLFA